MTHLTSFNSTNNENFISYNPQLASKLGNITDSLVLQLIKNWTYSNASNDRNLKEGRYWTFNTIDEWHKKYFPTLSKRTVQDSFRRLEKTGYINTSHYNTHRFDRTKWYTINTNKIAEFIDPRDKVWQKIMKAQIEQNPEKMHDSKSSTSEQENSAGCIYNNNNNIKEREIFNLEDWNPTAQHREAMVKKTGLDDKIILNALQEFKLHHQAYTNKVINNPEAAFELWCTRLLSVKRRYIKPTIAKAVQKQTKSHHQKDYLQSRFEENQRIRDNISNQNLITAEHIGDLAKKMRG